MKRTGAVIYVAAGNPAGQVNLDQQELECRRLCAGKGFEVAGVFRENSRAQAGNCADRAALMRAMVFSCKRRNGVKCLVVPTMDHIAHGIHDLMALYGFLQSHGITLVSVAQHEEDMTDRVCSEEHSREKQEEYHPLFPLKKTVRCSRCGHYLTGSVSRGCKRRYAYYFCPFRVCDRRGRTISKEKLEGEFRRALDHVVIGDHLKKVLDTIVQEYWQAKERFARDDTAMADQGLLNMAGNARSYTRSFLQTLSRQWNECSSPLREDLQQVIFPDGVPFDRERGFSRESVGWETQGQPSGSGSRS